MVSTVINVDGYCLDDSFLVSIFQVMINSLASAAHGDPVSMINRAIHILSREKVVEIMLNQQAKSTSSETADGSPLTFFYD